MRLVAIQPELVADIWPLLDDGMDKLLKVSLNLHSPDSIRDRCIKGDWLLFCMFDQGEPVVSVVVDIRDGEENRVLDVGFCWGSGVDTWIDQVYDSFETIARETGCNAIAFNGRPGWKMLAKRFGFRVQSMVFARDLT